MKKTLSALLLSGALTFSAAAAAAPAFTDTAGLQPWAAEAVAYVSEQGIMNGTGGGTFSPSLPIDRAAVAAIIWRLEGSPIGNITGTFSDVPLGQWYTDAVDWAAEEGIISGSGGKFMPALPVSRQDLVVMLYRYAGSPDAGRDALEDYSDREQIRDYALDAMSWAVSEGILSGSEGMLLPAGDTTRAQAAAILMRYLENL